MRKGTSLVMKSDVMVNCHTGGDLTALLHMCVGPCMTNMATVRLQPHNLQLIRSPQSAELL